MVPKKRTSGGRIRPNIREAPQTSEPHTVGCEEAAGWGPVLPLMSRGGWSERMLTERTVTEGF